jgi:hypothetical protein
VESQSLRKIEADLMFGFQFAGRPLPDGNKPLDHWLRLAQERRVAALRELAAAEDEVNFLSNAASEQNRRGTK